MEECKRYLVVVLTALLVGCGGGAKPGSGGQAQGDPKMLNNEMAAADACKAFAEAEEIYHRTDYDGDGVLEYAQSLKTLGDPKLGLIAEGLGEAEGNPGEATPRAGYCFKVLKAQGAKATGGARSYIVEDNMTLGYALLAYPEVYGSTGRHTFIINNNGTIFQKDLGSDTDAIVKQMVKFDPDTTWEPRE